MICTNKLLILDKSNSSTFPQTLILLYGSYKVGGI